MSLFQDPTPAAQDPNGGTPPAPAQAPVDANQFLTGIKNDQGEQKFKTAEDLVNGYQHSQEYIAKLQAEKDALAEQVKTQEQLQELVNGRPPADPAPAEPQAPATPQLSSEDIVKLIEQREADKVTATNVAKVSAAIAASFGAEHQKVLKAKCDELGLSQAVADTMAANSPDALLKLLGADAPAPAVPGVGNALNLGAQTPPEPAPYKFVEQMQSSNKTLDAWRSSVKETNARLGQ